MVTIKIIGEERLESLSAMLAYMGGNPCAVRSMWSHGEGLPEPFQWKKYPRETYLCEEIGHLREKIHEAKYWLTGRIDGTGPIVRAFLSGKNVEPKCFEYGLGAGNYVSPLIIRGIPCIGSSLSQIIARD